MSHSSGWRQNILITNNNVVFSEDTDKYKQTSIGATLPGSRWNSKFEAQINYDILPDGSEKDNAEATWNGERGSNARLTQSAT